MALSASFVLRQGLRCSRVLRSGSVFPSLVMPPRLLHQGDPPALPQLPVPQLQETLQKYLKTVKPLVTEEEYMVTEEIVKKFGNIDGIGQKLQQKLEERKKNTENWLSDWWINAAYLDCRGPLVVWSSPGLVFPLQEFKTLDDQLNYAAKVIAGTLDYKIMVDEKTVPVDRMGKDILDMSQYFKILGTCRIPGVTRDTIRFYGQEADPPKHIVVAHNNHFFKIDVYGKHGKPLNVRQLVHQLRNVVERSTHPTVPVGILTTQNRNVWGKAYKQLRKDKVNKASIEEIQRCIFLVSLDGPIVNPTGNIMTDAALNCVHGNGPQGYAGNRWYDKTIQFIVGKKGAVGLTYEHTPAEGPPIANLMDHIMDFMAEQQDPRPPAVELSRPQRLMFNISSEMKQEIEDAKIALESLVGDLEMTCFKFTGFGKNFIKSQKLSPDSFLQMAIQLAFFRIHQEPGAHYESASTRKYIYGRTETIRSCSQESVAFAQAMLKPDLPNAEKAKALRAAVEEHKNYSKRAVSGYGIDRHLLGLKLAAIEAGMDVPKLFMDVGYLRSSHMRLSTSQVPARCEAFMCYGPLVPDGYGCCYNPRGDGVFFGVSAFNSSPETDSATFREALEQSLMDMHDVIVKDGLKAKL
ncbi:carnitine O-acetyltransferase-like isoform X3 [Eriocheir sinensis]|uniref:carnitine O-acetyltransferase-like isoform X3 n=1 Tax=Eriocheir sinensis TaxID=95602 RepID=UPI0021CA92B8|nr:carnitine O-acetyltransferase-like isoform X3 [Eriocheir sinensis]